MISTMITTEKNFMTGKRVDGWMEVLPQIITLPTTTIARYPMTWMTENFHRFNEFRNVKFQDIHP